MSSMPKPTIKASTPKSEREINSWSIPSWSIVPTIIWVRWIIIHRRRRGDKHRWWWGDNHRRRHGYRHWHNFKILPAIRTAIFTNTIYSVCCIAVWTLYYYSRRICLGRNFFTDKISLKA